MTWIDLGILIVKCIVLSLAATAIFAYFTLFERRTLARLQNRVGPNRAGPGGSLQPIADAVKLFFKEDVTPLLADRWVYLVSPAFAVIPAIIIWATIPVGMWPDGQGGNWLQLAEINVGVLYLLAVTSVGVYGIAIAGWASNNKYSMLGGIRASAQVISYELALGLTVLGAVMQAQSFSTAEIVERQMHMWNIVPQFLGFVVFIIAATAEVVRAPFDLVEAEQELVGGYNTEYSSMKFALFFMSEYVKLVAMNAIAVTLFLGGWQFPGLQVLTQFTTQQYGAMIGNAVLGLTSLGAFLLKVLLLSFVSVWIRATLPRVRYDQLMNLGWKVLLPLALINVAVTAVVNVLLPDSPTIAALIGLVAGIVILAVTAVIGRPGKEKRTVTLVEIGAS
ncbi:MAG: NADH-quinone oxidoreductase subunit NuoH [Roseiflexus sp.]|jgi:NADH:ubiquinone oxidoreductase subunit 1 (chain H)|nr:NADH-quinone oxidoreductase subunit NuoH [Roseiflexus sp.]MBO9334898.1 NADH-quinone oxidoreductase subunit NuoH [Roseiflexus sp.]MBO9364676.1 NADH-quinone oxidoreductase subunit NuoH [Roseiflexus sp.]MBO9383853.1 NADH-quinone oxidoreductase subunit NuoH [Roseiflexus sp.]MBO9389570.1 NADH-quinone oxidoreductase subunit NuoH [Roseiflexus sp.]